MFLTKVFSIKQNIYIYKKSIRQVADWAQNKKKP